MVGSSFVHPAVVVASCVAGGVFISSAAFVCESHLRFVNRPNGGDDDDDERGICTAWAAGTNRVLHRFLPPPPDDDGFPGTTNERTEGLFVLGAALPFFVASTAVYGLSLLQRKRKSKKQQKKKSDAAGRWKSAPGDPPVWWWSFLVLALPPALIFVDVIRTVDASDDARSDGDDDGGILSVLLYYGMHLANPFGVAACISLSFFLVPVSRGSATVEWDTDDGGIGWSWSPVHALVFHRMAGWSSAFFTALHAALFCWQFVVMGEKYEHLSAFAALWSSLVPGRGCWPSWATPWSSPGHHDDETAASFARCFDDRYDAIRDGVGIGVDGGPLLFATMVEGCLEGSERSPQRASDMRCYGVWRNFTGAVSALSFLVLCLTSVPIVRRKFYGLFWKTHVVAGSAMLVFAVLHFSVVLMYVFPSMVYYLATTVPTLVRQHLWSSSRGGRDGDGDGGGVRIDDVTFVDDSGGCVEVTMPMSSAEHPCFPTTTDDENEDDDDGGAIRISTLSTPVYARVCVPSVSIIWHPFSVMIKPKKKKRRGDGGGDASVRRRSSRAVSLASADGESPPADPSETAAANDEEEEDESEVVILFRSVGPFTKAWAKSLRPTTDRERRREDPPRRRRRTPLLLLDGFYPGAFPIPKIMRRHDAIVMMAGGVGIVPFVSVLQAWHHLRRRERDGEVRRRCRRRAAAVDGGEERTDDDDLNRDRLPRTVVLYWSCREPGLVDHFLRRHLGFLWEKASDDDDDEPRRLDGPSDDDPDRPSVRIFCHLTRGGGGTMAESSAPRSSELREPLLRPPTGSALMPMPRIGSSRRSSDEDDDEEEECTAPSASLTSGSLTTALSSTSSLSSGGGGYDGGGGSTCPTDGAPRRRGRRRRDGGGGEGRRVRAVRFDWASFGVFALILWFSFLVQTWQYSRRIVRAESASFSARFRSIYLSLAWSALVAVLGELFRGAAAARWRRRTSRTISEEPSVDDDDLDDDDDDDDHGPLRCAGPSTGEEEEREGRSPFEGEEEEDDDDRSKGLPPPFGSRGEGAVDDVDGEASRRRRRRVARYRSEAFDVSVTVAAGRPDPDEAIRAVVGDGGGGGGVDRPAVLLCGPARLRESVRGAVRRAEQQQRRGSSRRRVRCSIYEEVSEM